MCVSLSTEARRGQRGSRMCAVYSLCPHLLMSADVRALHERVVSQLVYVYPLC